jgi:hypothetical protein
MSAASIDRYLAPAKAKDQIKGVSTTKKSVLLRNSIRVMGRVGWGRVTDGHRRRHDFWNGRRAGGASGLTFSGPSARGRPRYGGWEVMVHARRGSCLPAAFPSSGPVRVRTMI